MLLGKISPSGTSNPKCSRKREIAPCFFRPKLRLTGIPLLDKCTILKIYQPLGREGKVF